MKKETFPYLNKNLKFDKQKHKYTLGELELTSVTTWINSFEPPFNPYKVSEEVSKNVKSQYYQMDPKDIRALWSKTSTRGTNKHKEIEDWITYKSKTCIDEDFLKQINISPETTWSEVPVVSSKLLLSGTVDLIVKENNIYKIWDIKTSKKIDEKKLKHYSMQLLTYGRILHEVIKEDEWIEIGGIVLIQPSTNISEGVEHTFNKPEIVEIDYSVIDTLSKRLKNKYKNAK